MNYLRTILRWLTAAATVTLLIALGWHCVDIYTDGIASSATEAIFTAEKVSARLSTLALPFILYVLLVIVTAIYTRQQTPNRSRVNTSNRSECEKHGLDGKRTVCIQFIMLALSGGLILWGMLNGGMYDVFVKAINICTECIGLG